MATTTQLGGCTCPWSRWSSSRTRAASARSTSTRGSCASASSSSAARSTTRSRTSSSPSCCTSRPRTPRRTSRCTSTRPGGVVYAGLAIYDTMRFIKPDVATTCCGIAMSMGSLILAGGARRQALGAARTARILIHQPSGGFQGQATDIQIHAKEALALRRRIEEIYAEHTGQADRGDLRRPRARPLLHARAGGRVRPDRPRLRLRGTATATATGVTSSSSSSSSS